MHSLVCSVHSTTRVACAGHECVCPSNTATGATVGQATQRLVPNARSRHNEPLTDSGKHQYTMVCMTRSARSITQAACATLTWSCGPPQQHHPGCDCLERDAATRATHAQQMQQTVHRRREAPSYGGLACEARARSRRPPAHVARAGIVSRPWRL